MRSVKGFGWQGRNRQANAIGRMAIHHVLARHYGFTSEELAFIMNYDRQIPDEPPEITCSQRLQNDNPAASLEHGRE
jgi:hypothetical protein